MINNEILAMRSSLIGGLVSVAAGDDAKKMQNEITSQIIAILSGLAYLEIPLNGGSDTRRGIRECWEERCRIWGIPFQAIGGCLLIIGKKAIKE